MLKSKVKTWLVQKKEVIAFAHACAADGGNGALLVLLKPTGPQPSNKAEAARAPRPTRVD